MEVLTTHFTKTNFHSSLIKSYLNKELDDSLYTAHPSLEAFKAQRKTKLDSYPPTNRSVLVAALKDQYAQLNLSAPAVDENIQKLGDQHTFTVCTGHQLNIFTGPLFFIYKILHTIKLSQILNERFDDMHCVPIYWMASEDHDSAEIDHLHIKKVKLKWNTDQTGAVGDFETKDLEQVIALIRELLPGTAEAAQLIELFTTAYRKGAVLADATILLVHELFKPYGLVVMNPQNRALKSLFKPVIERELQVSFSKKEVDTTSDNLKSKGFSAQVHAREINLFFIDKQSRERIIRDGEHFVLSDSKRRFSKDELWRILNEAPEHFSPNVVLRPIYQETILPNLAYVGGGGELSYALQLKAAFDAVSVPFPLFILRHSLFWVTPKNRSKMKALGTQMIDFTTSKDATINGVIRRISDIDIDLSPQRAVITEQFRQLKDLALSTDKSFIGAVLAQEKKQLKGLDTLEKRLLKAQRRKLADQVQRISEIYDQFYPMGVAHERFENFSALYAQMGNAFFEHILSAFSADLGHGQLLLLELPQGVKE
ncbi:MAG: bacillithiol biosynthesis cysteine-adding enzyme BshC [Bacteroidetes bacterium]|nr:bacillithiol biosynthesis cysteine-adding enzyme BshC [Bacteroidota bacterium]MDA0950213.1 bacillithiol biosynthesis cysteine-adding enzyme BshC [Bacteroidota bacterium]